MSSTLGAMLDVPKVRNRIPAIIHGLKTKDATHLESAVAEVNAFYTELMQGYSQFSSSIPLVQIISQSENNTRLELTAEEVQKRKRPIVTSQVSTFLTNKGWPNYEKDEFYGTLPEQLPNTMILHGTLDPKLTFSAQSVVKALGKAGDIKFVDIVDGVHFIALNSPSCFAQQVSLFLNDKLPVHSKCTDENTVVGFK